MENHKIPTTATPFSNRLEEAGRVEDPRRLTHNKPPGYRLEEAGRVEDPASLGNTMQVGRRPTQLGATQTARQVPRRGTSTTRIK